MAISVKKIVLWRKEVENRPGTLAGVLEPLAAAGTDLQVMMGYRYPGDAAKAAIEVCPVTGRKVQAAAQTAGFAAASIPALLVEGDNKPGLGHAMAKVLAEANINLDFLVAQVIGRKYSAVFGFETAEDAAKAVSLLKKAAAPKKR